MQVKTKNDYTLTGYQEEILPFEGGETLEQVAQRGCGCPSSGGQVDGIPGSLIYWVATKGCIFIIVLSSLEVD